jgi:hypothetical protein
MNGYSILRVGVKVYYTSYKTAQVSDLNARHLVS